MDGKISLFPLSPPPERRMCKGYCNAGGRQHERQNLPSLCPNLQGDVTSVTCVVMSTGVHSTNQKTELVDTSCALASHISFRHFARSYRLDLKFYLTDFDEFFKFKNVLHPNRSSVSCLDTIHDVLLTQTVAQTEKGKGKKIWFSFEFWRCRHFVLCSRFLVNGLFFP